MQPLTLDKVAPYCFCVVRCVALPRPIALRFAELGIVPDTVLMIKKKAPLNNPIEILLRNYTLVMRVSEAKCITCLPC